MSKGHGKWERAILNTLDHVGAFYLTDLLPDPHTRGQTVTLNRAARNLEAASKIEMIRWLTGGAVGAGYLTVYPAIRRLSDIRLPGLNVARVTASYPCNT